MAANPQALAQAKHRWQRQATQSVFMAAPQGGINALAGAGAVPPTDALFLYNLIPQEYGNAVRLGYREWCQPVPIGTGVRTVIPYNAFTATVLAQDRLFAATDDGIYECTVEGSLPVKVQDWAIKGGVAGWCSWTAYTTIAGKFLLVCDLANGYYIYTEATNTWVKVTMGNGTNQINGVDPVLLDYVMVWKNRVWFVQQDSGLGWYLPVGAIQGTVKSFEFGNKFRYGGFLKSLSNWTLDAGDGVDDYLVALSAAGDVMIYQGTDPETVGAFNLKGVWWVGKVPQGRRQTTTIGGDLMVLSTYGLIEASKLISGLPRTDADLSISHKINPRINTNMGRTYQSFGWEVKVFPREQIAIVVSPKEANVEWNQYVYSLTTRAWCQFVGVPILTCEAWQARFYLGTTDNRLFTYDGFADNVLIADNGASQTPVTWEMLTGFQTFDQPGVNKRVQFLRPRFIGAEIPSYNIEARYDFDLLGLPPPFPTSNYV